MNLTIHELVRGLWCPNRHWLELALAEVAKRYGGTPAQVRALIAALDDDVLARELADRQPPSLPSQRPGKWQLENLNDHHHAAPWVQSIGILNVWPKASGYMLELQLRQATLEASMALHQEIARAIGTEVFIGMRAISMVVAPKARVRPDDSLVEVDLLPLYAALGSNLAHLLVYDPGWDKAYWQYYSSTGARETHRPITDGVDLAGLLCRETEKAPGPPFPLTLNMTAEDHEGWQWRIVLGLRGFQEGVQAVDSNVRGARAQAPTLGMAELGFEITISPETGAARENSGMITALRGLTNRIVQSLEAEGLPMPHEITPDE